MFKRIMILFDYFECNVFNLVLSGKSRIQGSKKKCYWSIYLKYFGRYVDLF